MAYKEIDDPDHDAQRYKKSLLDLLDSGFDSNSHDFKPLFNLLHAERDRHVNLDINQQRCCLSFCPMTMGGRIPVGHYESDVPLFSNLLSTPDYGSFLQIGTLSYRDSPKMEQYWKNYCKEHGHDYENYLENVDDEECNTPHLTLAPLTFLLKLEAKHNCNDQRLFPCAVYVVHRRHELAQGPEILTKEQFSIAQVAESFQDMLDRKKDKLKLTITDKKELVFYLPVHSPSTSAGRAPARPSRMSKSNLPSIRPSRAIRAPREEESSTRRDLSGQGGE